MKATTIAVALTTFLGAALANPVAVSNAEAPDAVAKRAELETRQGLPAPIAILIPNTPPNTIPNLIPVGPGTVPIGNLQPILESIVRSVLSLLANLRSGVADPGANLPPLPTIPPFTNLPAPITSIAPGNISVEQALAIIQGLSTVLGNLTALTRQLPAGTGILSTLLGAGVPPAQLSGVISVVNNAASIAGPIVSQLQDRISNGGITLPPTSGGVAQLETVTNLLSNLPVIGAILSGVLSTITSLLGGLGGLGGIGGGARN